jgi:hypothetical protein
MTTAFLTLPVAREAVQTYQTSTVQAKREIEQSVSNTIVSFHTAEQLREQNKTLYDQDAFEWTQAIATLLRSGRWNAIDLHTLAEEIESMGASQYDAVSSAVYQVLVHLLKWRYQPHRRSNSWRASVVEHRNRISRKLRRAPSLATKIPLMVADEYAGACRKASAQTGLPINTFPSHCPWTEEQIRSDDFWPEEASTHREVP